MIMIEYPKCSTCQKAKKYLENKSCEIIDRDIVKNTPSKDELNEIIKKSGKEVNKFFNTSGLKYKELKLKDKLPKMTYEEKIELLASDGMLIKRPLLILDEDVLIGFKEKEWENIK